MASWQLAREDGGVGLGIRDERGRWILGFEGQQMASMVVLWDVQKE